ncbi:MAG: diguanylate cyclase, partial [Planctomycetota bacterium]
QQSEARTDALTDLHNRRAFDAAMEENLARYRRQGTPYSLMLFDVDHFKQFNDTHGHQAGDEVLRAVGATLKKVVKSSDLACRYGGEEFAVVMPNTNARNGRVAADRVRRAIDAMTIDFEGKQLTVTASVGIAEMLRSDDAQRLIRRADDAVYTSKEAGRNCGYWHDGEACLPLDQDAMQTSPGAALADVEAAHNALPDGSVFLDELRRRISESHRFGMPLSVMYLRVKRFASFEQDYGESFGKLVLESVAQFVRSTLREMDLLGALDRGDFIVMLPGSAADEAAQVGRRIQTAISNCKVPLGNQELALEVCHGVSDVRPDDDASALVERARTQIDDVAADDVTSASLAPV